MPSERAVAVLFDLDGVIVDSRRFHLATWEELARAHDFPAKPGYFTDTFGLRNDAILGQLVPNASAEEQQRLADEKESRFRELARGNVEPLPGAKELIEFLAAQGIQQAVVTSTPRPNLDLILDELRIAGAFQALVSAEDTSKGKPDPEGFLLAAERLDAPPARCIVIEDAPAGLQAAKRAGMRAIGVTSTHPAADLADADLVVDSLTEESVRLFILT